MQFLILLLINFIVVELVDRQNIPNQIANYFIRKLTKNKFTYVNLTKPFNCSYCITFWLSFIYMILTNDFGTLPICLSVTYSLVNAILTRTTYYILGLFDRLIEKIFKTLYDYTN